MVDIPEGINAFDALGDPVRRDLLKALAERGSASATTLAAGRAITRQAVLKHLQTLEAAGLVTSGRFGREVLYSVLPTGMTDAATWLTGIASRWDARLDSIRRAAESGA